MESNYRLKANDGTYFNFKTKWLSKCKKLHWQVQNGKAVVGVDDAFLIVNRFDKECLNHLVSWLGRHEDEAICRCEDDPELHPLSLAMIEELEQAARLLDCTQLLAALIKQRARKSIAERF